MEKYKHMYKHIVDEALKQYDLEIQSVEFLVEETNLFYKVVATDGTKYAMKLFQELSSNLEENLAEVFFLQSLGESFKGLIPTPILAKDGSGIITIHANEEGIDKRIALYSWVEGDDIDGIETLAMFEELGELVAKLHQKTAAIEIPDGISPKPWDKVFYYHDEVPVYKEERFQAFISDAYVDVMDALIPILNHELKKLYDSEKPRLIHGDLNPWNVKLHDEQLKLVDFEEAMLGHPIQDVAICFFYYYHDDKWSYPEVKKAFEKGYGKVIQLDASGFDQEIIDMLITARRVNFLNYILEIDDAPSAYIEKNLPRAKAFLDAYLAKNQ